MTVKSLKLPRSESSLRIGRAVARHLKKPLEERLQVLVKAKLATQAEVDAAIERIKNNQVNNGKSTKTTSTAS